MMHSMLMVAAPYVLMGMPDRRAELTVFVDRGVPSQVLQLEWKRDWRLKSLRHELEFYYKVKFVDANKVRNPPLKLPSMRLGRGTKTTHIHAPLLGSGQSIKELHRLGMEVEMETWISCICCNNLCDPRRMKQTQALGVFWLYCRRCWDNSFRHHPRAMGIRGLP